MNLFVTGGKVCQHRTQCSFRLLTSPVKRFREDCKERTNIPKQENPCFQYCHYRTNFPGVFSLFCPSRKGCVSPPGSSLWSCIPLFFQQECPTSAEDEKETLNKSQQTQGNHADSTEDRFFNVKMYTRSWCVCGVEINKNDLFDAKKSSNAIYKQPTSAHFWGDLHHTVASDALHLAFHTHALLQLGLADVREGEGKQRLPGPDVQHVVLLAEQQRGVIEDAVHRESLGRPLLCIWEMAEEEKNTNTHRLSSHSRNGAERNRLVQNIPMLEVQEHT